MSKYKLIKEYPGSPELNSIYYHYSDDIWRSDKPTYTVLRGLDKYPEFWEKVIEKDYKVLSFVLISNNDIKRILNEETGLFYHSMYNKSREYDFDYLKSSNDYSIYSVKRLSDGEIFTVGDYIESHGSVKIIKTINMPPNTPGDIGFVTILENKEHLGYQYLFKDMVEKVKNPLFKTDDGVNIYEGDKIYWTLPDGSGKISNMTTSKHSKDFHVANSSSYKTFSSHEKALEYIIMNKKCLSINDILSNGEFTYKSALEELKQKVKNKLN